jgi:RimJ/RimL family protein N-acetyltransferase
MRADVIVSERLELPLLAERQLAELAAGQAVRLEDELEVAIPAAWVQEVRRLAGYRLEQGRAFPEDRPWLVRAIIRRQPRAMAGYINFHGRPDPRGVPEIGYTLLPEHRGHGYATEAVRACFDWAAREHGVRRFRASVAPDNEPSLRVIRRLGFVRVGEQWDDEDGLEFVFEADWPMAEDRPRGA